MRLIKRYNDESIDYMRDCSVRIGTLLGYRNTEDSIRGDKKEGYRGIELETGKVYTGEDLNRINECAGSRIRFATPEMTFKVNASQDMHIRSEVNAFVFCASIDNGPSPYLDEKFGKNKILIKNPKLFAEMVMNQLLSSANEVFSPELNELFDSMLYRISPVKYAEKEPYKSSDIQSSSNQGESIMEDCFIKPPIKDFIAESEFRFMWFPYNYKKQSIICLPETFDDHLDIHIPKIWDSIDEQA